MGRKGIQLKHAEEVITNESISSVSAEQQENGEWTCFITFFNSDSMQIEEVYIEKQRDGMRTWADPRKMFDFMYVKFGITDGQFKICEHRERK
ncbi:hypothetical protein AB0001_004825 [Salmonella enterica]|nr:hypothetical protein [Salmonella enterica]EEP3373106.1 hypothetical protein [Salmonella enterica]EFP6579666.1 hypothetical protein [Salmonella enterica]EGC7971433.1 hypothetical protein [Salmonella enterica]EIV4461658.1 hypothetical protein [Salmonella enterica]